MSKLRVSILLLPFLMLVACDRKPAATAGAIQVVDPWARPAAEGANSAAFMVIRNTGGSTDRLIGAESAAATMVEIHQTVIKDDVMSMSPVGHVDAPSRGEVALKPGSYHVMLMRMKEELATGGSVTVTLVFRDAGRVAVVVPVDQR